MNTAEMVVELLGRAGVKYMFGVPGAAIEDLNTALYHNRHGILPIVTKHEEGAAFMADGYARVSGQLGVCFATSGPGATNLINGLVSAYADQISVLALTGQVPTSVFGRGAIQESGSEGIDLTHIFSNFTKYSSMLVSECRAQYTLQKAIRLALSAPEGPVHINMPADIMRRPVELNERDISPNPGKASLFDADKADRAVELLTHARRPAIIAGWGVYLSRALPELLELSELLQIPVATSPKAKGVFPESHELSLGVLGFAGTPLAKEYLIDNDVDVLLAVGTSFSEMMTNGWDDHLQPSEHLIHLDVDVEKIGKNYQVSHHMLGDPKMNLKKIIQAVESTGQATDDRTQQNKQLREVLKRQPKNKIFPPRNNLYHPAQLVLDVQRLFPENSIFLRISAKKH
ncbi:MAG: thiamine pyrophosphate-binding protein, partial [Candidatus Electrothrix sp. ATG2]|nr:thiamine pyrophosphate-binding protein [Candidatus Electrothrix sp. ATG2]